MTPTIIKFGNLQIANGFAYRAGSPLVDLMNSFSSEASVIDAQINFDENSIFFIVNSVGEQGNTSKDKIYLKGAITYGDESISSLSITQVGEISRSLGGPYSGFWFGEVSQLTSPLNIANPKDPFSVIFDVNSQDQVSIARYNANANEFDNGTESITESGAGLSGVMDFFEASNFEELGLDASFLYSQTSIEKLYLAAFGRMPDDVGLQYWTNVVNDPVVSFKDISEVFISSPEFSNIVPHDSSNDEFVGALWQNVKIDNPFVGEGFLVNELNTGSIDRAEALAIFSDSEANISYHRSLI